MIPAYFGEVNVLIETDIVDADIPLLFSKAAMKKGKMHLKCDEDILVVFNQSLPLNTTSNNLYSLPITRQRALIDEFKDDQNQKPVVLKAVSVQTDTEITKKLHRCFAHPAADRLIRLKNNVGAHWSNNDNLKKEIKK